MANTAIVTKQSITQDSSGMYTVTIQMVVNDGASDIFTGTASAKYNDNSPDLGAVKANLQGQIQDQWDKFTDENTLFNAAAFDTMVSQIQTAANTYVNA